MTSYFQNLKIRRSQLLFATRILEGFQILKILGQNIFLKFSKIMKFYLFAIFFSQIALEFQRKHGKYGPF